jgi:hypothetical protein
MSESTELTIDNCTASDIISELGEGMDFMPDAPSRRWLAFFTAAAYCKVKSDPEGFIYERGGREYVRVWDNQRIPFIVHMEVASTDADISTMEPYSLGCRREMEEAARP